MKRRLASSTVLLAGLFAGAALAQVVGYNFRSGDVWVDSQLGYISDYGRRDHDYFVEDMVNSFGAPRYLVNDLLDKRHWSPGDVYYAAALAYTAHRPLNDAVREYEQNRGQGWGVVAQRMGIKPGSAEFHALKGQLGKSKGRYDERGKGNGHGPAGDDGHGRPADAGPPGNSGKGHGNSGKGREDGDEDEGHGDEHGKGNGGGHGKGNSGKGHGH